MQLLYKGNKPEKIINFERENFIFKKNEWTWVSNPDLYLTLKKHNDIFDAKCFYDLRQFDSIKKYVKFKKDLVITSNKPVVIKLRKMPWVKEQAFLRDSGEWVFKIITYNISDLKQYNEITGSKVRVLIYRTLGGVGDVIMTTPIIEEARKEFPHYEIIAAYPQDYYSVIENNQFADKVIPFTDDLTKEKWDTAIDLTSDCIRHEVKTMPNVDLNRVEIFANKCGLEIEKIPSPKVFLTQEEIEDVKKQYGNENLKIGLVLRSNAPVRNWPYFNKLRKKIIEKYPDCQIFDIAKGKPKDYIESNNSIQIFDKNLRQVMAIINECDIVIGPDTGIMHIASSMKIPTVWLFTHIDGSIRTKNYDQDITKVIQGKCNLFDKPCWYDIHCHNTDNKNLLENKNNAACAKKITVANVMKHINKLISIPNISYVIMCMNGKSITQKCLRLIGKWKKYNEEIILIDNGSDDNTDKMVTFLDKNKALGDKFKYIKNEKNAGVVKGRNQAIKKSKGRFVFTLDNDQFISADSIHRLINVEGDVIGTEAWSLDNEALAHKLTIGEKLAYVGGGGLIVKRKIYKELNYFDEIFNPIWFEDLDFCFRAKELDYIINYHPDPHIEHLGGSTSQNIISYDSQEIWDRNYEIFKERYGYE